MRFAVGVPDSLPKLITFRILEPVLHLPERVQLVCAEGHLEHLLLQLAAHKLDLVLSDVPANPTSSIRVYNHLLGQCAVSVFGTPKQAKKLRNRFPSSLNGERVLLPTPGTVLRRSLEQWFHDQDIRPVVAAELQDSALTKTFGQAGFGVFFAPSAIEDEICRQFHVDVAGRAEEVTERFYAVTPERRINHPGVEEISKKARKDIFASN